MADLTIQPDEIDWRIGATYDGRDGKMAMLLGYIDARLAMDKLDTLDANWSSHIEVMRLGGKDGIRCSLTVNGVTREDVGTASDTEPLKGAVSDALKRAAVHFGIGRELYDLPSIAVQVEVKSNGKIGKPKALPVWKDGRWTIDSTLGWVKYDHEPSVPGPARRRSKPAPSLDQIKQRLLERADEHNIAAAQLDELIREYVPVNPDPDALMAGLITLGTDIAAGKYDGGAAGAPPEPSGEPTGQAEQMSAEEAIAAGAALAGKA